MIGVFGSVLVKEKETIMINSVSLDKIRTSVVTKVAGLFVLAVLAIAFFILPSSAFAALPKLPLLPLGGIYKSCGSVMTVEVDNKLTTNFMAAPIYDHVGLSELPPSSIVYVILPNGQHATGLYLNKQTHQAAVVINGHVQFVTLVDSSNK